MQDSKQFLEARRRRTDMDYLSMIADILSTRVKREFAALLRPEKARLRTRVNEEVYLAYTGKMPKTTKIKARTDAEKIAMLKATEKQGGYGSLDEILKGVAKARAELAE